MRKQEPTLEEPENLFCTGSQVGPGVCGIHGLFQCSDASDDGEEGVNPGVVAGGGIGGNAARKGDDLSAIFFCQRSDTYGSLSHSGLMIKTAFSGDDNVSIL